MTFSQANPFERTSDYGSPITVWPRMDNGVSDLGVQLGSNTPVYLARSMVEAAMEFRRQDPQDKLFAPDVSPSTPSVGDYIRATFAADSLVLEGGVTVVREYGNREYGNREYCVEFGGHYGVIHTTPPGEPSLLDIISWAHAERPEPVVPVEIDGYLITKNLNNMYVYLAHNPEEYPARRGGLVGVQDLEDAYSQIARYSTTDKYNRNRIPALVAITKFIAQEKEAK